MKHMFIILLAVLSGCALVSDGHDRSIFEGHDSRHIESPEEIGIEFIRVVNAQGNYMMINFKGKDVNGDGVIDETDRDDLLAYFNSIPGYSAEVFRIDTISEETVERLRNVPGVTVEVIKEESALPK